MAAGRLALKGPNSPIDKFNKDRFGAQGPRAGAAVVDNESNEANTQGETQDPHTEAENDNLFEVVVDNGAGDSGDPFDLA